jgi:dTMP kinase
MPSRLANVKFRTHDHPGRLVIVEGSDGTGKTTLIEGLEQHFERSGVDYIRTRQPTTEARELDAFKTFLFAPERRDEIDYRALLCMMIGDRLQHIHQVIEPALKRGAVVLCDRYIFTQMVTTRTRGQRDERWMFDLYDHVLRPDVGIITDAPLDVACRRIAARDDWRESFHERDHVERNLVAYRQMAEIFNLSLCDTHEMDTGTALNYAITLLNENSPVSESR